MTRSIRYRHLGLATLGVVLGALAAAVLALSSVGSAAPTPLVLTFEGGHFSDDNLPGGLRHDGRFTASAPVCAAGRGYDIEHVAIEPLTVRRMHVCDDGTGTFTALMPTVRNEHGGSGSWRIVEGTGRYAALRGFGSYTGTLVSGNPLLFDTVVFRTSWQGTIDFDADPPVIQTFTATARKVRSRPRTYALRIVVAMRDSAAPMSYSAAVRIGRSFPALKRGSTASGRATVTVRIRPPRTARSLRIELTAEDAVGNETRAARTVRLR